MKHSDEASSITSDKKTKKSVTFQENPPITHVDNDDQQEDNHSYDDEDDD